MNQFRNRQHADAPCQRRCARLHKYASAAWRKAQRADSERPESFGEPDEPVHAFLVGDRFQVMSLARGRHNRSGNGNVAEDHASFVPEDRETMLRGDRGGRQDAHDKEPYAQGAP